MKRLLLIIIAVGILAGCSIQKNTLVNRTYHNITAKYNYLFNAQESFNESTKKFSREYAFDYNNTLPIFLFNENSAPSKTAEGMDRAILKSGMLIKYHSITAKPDGYNQNTPSKRAFYNQREFCKYVDDAYLLIAKSNAYLHEFSKARQAFEQVIGNYKDANTVSEALVWRAIIAGAENDLILYQDALSAIEHTKTFDPECRAFLYAAYADYYVKKKDIPKAIENLSAAVNLEKNKHTRSRYRFILGQLYQANGDKKAAQALFQKVSRTAPSYEMAFNAKLEEARSFTTGKPSELRNALLKMAKSEKNTPYKDQIYYTIGKIYLADKDEKTALEFFQKSIEFSSPNSNQKGITFYTLAELAYSKKDFLKAESLYDSASLALSSSHPYYIAAERRAKKISKLATSMREYKYLDSLIILSKMNDDERNKIIDSKISELTEKQAKAQEEQSRQQQYLMSQSSLSLGKTQSNSWYFYNQSTLAFGAAEFKMRWGQRRLEDNWRRKNKGNISEMEMVEERAEEKGGVQKLSPLSREYYLTNLPKNDADRQKMEIKKTGALLEAADAYRADLDDTNEAIKAAKEVLASNPTAEQELKAYTICYQAYLAENDADQIQHYKNLIVSKYPKSGLAISFNNVTSSRGSSSTEEQKLLITCIEYLNKGQFQASYDIASKQCQDSLSADAPRFALVRAMSLGGLKGRDEYRKELAEIVRKYPSHEAAKAAQSYIEQLDRVALGNLSNMSSKSETGTKAETDSNIQQPNSNATNSQFEKQDGEHLLIIVIPQNSNFNQLKFNLISFNLETYPDVEFTVSSQLFDSKNIIVTIKPFTNKNSSVEYYYKLLEKQDIISQAGVGNFALFAISKNNMAKLEKDKAITSYSDFFVNEYLK